MVSPPPLADIAQSCDRGLGEPVTRVTAIARMSHVFAERWFLRRDETQGSSTTFGFAKRSFTFESPRCLRNWGGSDSSEHPPATLAERDATGPRALGPFGG